MLSSKEIICPNNLLDLAHKKKGVKVAVVNAGKPLPMLSIQDAVNENLIEPIFIGHEVEIQKCAEDIKWDISKYELIHEPVENDTAKIAAKLASEKKVKIIIVVYIVIIFNFEKYNTKYDYFFVSGLLTKLWIVD